MVPVSFLPSRRITSSAIASGATAHSAVRHQRRAVFLIRGKSPGQRRESGAFAAGCLRYRPSFPPSRLLQGGRSSAGRAAAAPRLQKPRIRLQKPRCCTSPLLVWIVADSRSQLSSGRFQEMHSVARRCLQTPLTFGGVGKHKKLLQTQAVSDAGGGLPASR